MRRTARASDSTKVTCAAPRLSASIPSAPVPAYPSSTRALADGRPQDVEQRLAQPIGRRPQPVPGRGFQLTSFELAGDDSHRQSLIPDPESADRDRESPILNPDPDRAAVGRIGSVDSGCAIKDSRSAIRIRISDRAGHYPIPTNPNRRSHDVLTSEASADACAGSSSAATTSRRASSIN